MPTLRTDTDIKVPDSLQQLCHSHAGIEAAEPLAALKLENKPEIACFHAVIEKTIVADFLETGRKYMHQVAPDEFGVLQGDLTFWSARI